MEEQMMQDRIPVEEQVIQDLIPMDKLMLKEERRKFNRVGLAFFAFSVLSLLSSVGLQLMFRFVCLVVPALKGVEAPEWLLYAFTILSLYAVAGPIVYLILRTTPAERPRHRRMPFWTLLLFALIAFFFMIAGSTMSTPFRLVQTIVRLILSGTEQGAGELISDAYVITDVGVTLIYACIIAPIMEELFFRKFLIDRLRGVGDITVILMSGLMFGLFHCNIDQFFYATLVGMLFAYIYLNTGNILHCMVLHCIMNVCGGLIPVVIQAIAQLSGLVEAANESTVGLLIYIFLSLLPSIPQYILAFVGMILFGIFSVNIFRSIRRGELSFGKDIGAAFGNAGMILFILACLLQTLERYIVGFFP